MSERQERCHIGSCLSDESAQHDAECTLCLVATSYEVRPFGLLSCVLRMISAHVAGDEARWRNYGEFLCQQIEQDGPDSRATAERFRTHCDNGHEFTPQNTRLKKGGRMCRTCCSAKRRITRRSRKAAA